MKCPLTLGCPARVRTAYYKNRQHSYTFFYPNGQVKDILWFYAILNFLYLITDCSNTKNSQILNYFDRKKLPVNIKTRYGGITLNGQ